MPAASMDPPCSLAFPPAEFWKEWRMARPASLPAAAALAAVLRRIPRAPAAPACRSVAGGGRSGAVHGLNVASEMSWQSVLPVSGFGAPLASWEEATQAALYPNHCSANQRTARARSSAKPAPLVSAWNFAVAGPRMMLLPLVPLGCCCCRCTWIAACGLACSWLQREGYCCLPPPIALPPSPCSLPRLHLPSPRQGAWLAVLSDCQRLLRHVGRWQANGLCGHANWAHLWQPPQ